jgi:hypothetical protein
MREVVLKPGDVFCTASTGLLGRVICWSQSAWEVDGRAEFSHSGFISMRPDTTVEELPAGLRYGTLDRYYGLRVLVGRHQGMDLRAFILGRKAWVPHLGRPYPWWRLALHLVPFLPRLVFSGAWYVCSERTAAFLVAAVGFPAVKGVTPGYLADAIERWDDFEVVADGVYGEDWSIQKEGEHEKP